jgi:feruloyl esterase
MSPRSVRFRALASIAAGALVALASPAFAQANPGETCASMAGMTIANGEVTSAEIVQAGGFDAPAMPFGPPPGVVAATFRAMPDFCRVKVTLRPSSDSDIKVEVWLPAKGWNGKFVGIGNGIWGGSLSYFQMSAPLTRGYAVAATDTGHVGTGLSADFAAGKPEKLIDFGHRSVHLMAVTGKQSISRFYGSKPLLSLWDSCSTGGRQGLIAVHRYPEDFDAISAMAPANPMTSLMTQTMWTGWMTARTPQSRMTMPKLASLHRAVLAQCDARDGLKDGIVGNPATCRFDPAVLQCRKGDADTCLTAPQVEAMRGIYRGVRGRDGKVLLPGFTPGSEMQLIALIGAPEPFPVAATYFKLLVHGDNPAWDWRTMDYESELAAARRFGGATLDVPHDGLSAFFARGGKLLLSHGWNDGLIPAENTLAFYKALKRSLPAAQAHSQLRLFMVPGMDHCSGGEGASAFDTLGALESWTSSGAPPSRIIAARMAPPIPGAPASPPLTRPLCPYPAVAHYDGKGDPASAASFSCRADGARRR